MMENSIYSIHNMLQTQYNGYERIKLYVSIRTSTTEVEMSLIMKLLQFLENCEHKRLFSKNSNVCLIFSEQKLDRCMN